MARVPDYSGPQVARRQTGPLQVGGIAPDNSAIAQGLQSFQRGAQILAEREREKADTAALMDVDNQLTQWQQDAFYNDSTGVYARKGKNALDITNQTLDSFDKAQQEFAKGLTNDRQRARYQQIIASRRQSLANELNRYEYGERQRYYGDVEKGQIDTAMQGAALGYQDPNQIEQNRAKMNAVLASRAERLGMALEAAQAAQLEANSALSSAVISRMLADDFGRAKGMFDAYKEGMTADDQVKISNAIEREQKQREIEARQMQAIARAELSSRVNDATSAYLAGFDFADPPTRDQFQAAYGAADGNKAFEQFQRTQEIGTAIRGLATADSAERQQMIAEFMPTQNGVAGEGFQRNNQLYGTLVNAAVRLEKERETDPAGYALRYSPEVMRAAQAADSGDPAAAEAYAAASLAEQQRLGVSSPRLLSNQQAASIAAQFANTDDGGNNSATMISSLQQQWGKNWPLVFKQLQNDLPGSAMVIGTGLDGNTAARLARLSSVKTDELKKGLDSTKRKDATDALNEGFAPFRNTLAAQVGGERTFATLYGEAERLAYSYMAEGVDAKDAAERAMKAMVNDKYTIRGTWRAPISMDADLIERGARLTQESIDPAELQFAVPKGVSEEFARGRVKSAIESDGQWVTLPDESGLALYYGGEAVLDKAGNPVSRSFEELTGAAAANPSAWQQARGARAAEFEIRRSMAIPGTSR